MEALLIYNTMKIATWNINSLRSRFDHIISWLRSFQPDVVLLQELKLVAELFPYDLFLDEGYHAAVFGQKTYNGVAILSKHRIEDIRYGFDNNPLPGEARYVDALIDGQIRVASVYVPNGQTIRSPKFPLKLQFIEALANALRKNLEDETPFVIGGDFNVAPKDFDASYPEKWVGDVPFTQEERLRYGRLLHLGFHDAVRIKYPYNSHNNPDTMTWWGYRGAAFEKNNGLRIDHILLCPKSTDLFVDAGTDRIPRTWEKASDHTPAWCQLSLS